MRANLILRGETLNGFARAHGVSHVLVHRLIAGLRPGCRGRSAVVRAQLEELSK